MIPDMSKVAKKNFKTLLYKKNPYHTYVQADEGKDGHDE